MARLQLDDSFFANVYGYNRQVFKIKKNDCIEVARESPQLVALGLDQVRVSTNTLNVSWIPG